MNIEDCMCSDNEPEPLSFEPGDHTPTMVNKKTSPMKTVYPRKYDEQRRSEKIKVE